MAAAMNAARVAALNPARCWRAESNPEVLLSGKLAWLLLLCSGFLSRAGQTDATAAAQLGVIPDGLTWVFRIVFVAAGALLLTNQFTRAASAIAGACVLLTPMLSPATWRSHEWICGMVLLLGGLEAPGCRPWLLRIQATLGLAAVALEPLRDIDWTTRPTLEGWQVDRDSQALLGLLRNALPAGVMHVLAGWLAPASAILFASGLWIRRFRAPALWLSAGWLLAGAVLVGSDEAAFFGLGVLIALLSFLEWPRERLVAHWPRACGWPMWLRIALDHYDFDQKTEWPFPQNPDADLDVWADDRHVRCRHAITALLLYFPLFHMAVFAASVVMILILPQPWTSVAHACIGGWLLAFFAPTSFVPAGHANRSH